MKKWIVTLMALCLLGTMCCSVYADDKLTHGEILFSEDFSTTLDELTSRENVSVTVGAACELDIVDGQLMTKVASTSKGEGDIFLDIPMEFPEKFVFSYRYMVESAADGEGSVACFILYPNASVRVLNNGNTGSIYKYTDGVANGNAEMALETKFGVYYTLYTAVDQASGTYSMYRKADGDAEYTVITEDMKLQEREGTPSIRLMIQRNSNAVAYMDEIIVREYDPNYVAPTAPVETAPETTETPAAVPESPATLDVILFPALAAGASITLICFRKRLFR